MLMSLPEDLMEYLDSGSALQYDESTCECGTVTLHRADSIRKIKLQFGSNEEGEQSVAAYDLVATCEGYSPEGILVFVPSIKMFGSYDTDHRELYVYPKKSWSHISAAPLAFLNAQWFPQDGVGKKLTATALQAYQQFVNRNSASD